jgi:Trk K+ transport system NAD-binding subunit
MTREQLMIAHTVLIGYGATGRHAARTLPDQDASCSLVVVDTDCLRGVLATRDGARFVRGDGGDLAALRAAETQQAGRVVVAVPDDAVAVRITSLARSLNRIATIVTLLHAPHWRALALCVGADQTVIASSLVGGLLGMSVQHPERLDRVGRALAATPELVVAERGVDVAEVGCDPRTFSPLVLAVIRGGTRRWIEDPGVGVLRAGDRLLVVHAAPGGPVCT